MVASRPAFIVIVALVLGASFAIPAEDVPETAYDESFDKAEYLPGTTTGQMKAGQAVKGTLVFDTQKRNVDFLQESGSPALSIKFDSIKTMTYERASKPRMAEAVLISPLFLLSSAKKHYLTIQYADESGVGKYAILHLHKKNAQQAVACAEAQTGKKVEQIAEK